MKSVKIISLGVSISVVLTIILLVIFSVVLEKTNFNEMYIDIIVTICSSVSILIGTTITGKKIKKRGSIYGGVVAGFYLLALYILSSIMEGNFEITKATIIALIVSIVTGIIGGIVGVNIN